MPDRPQENEFTRWLEVDKIPPRGQQLTIVARPEECVALAHRLGLLELSSLAATLDVHRAADGVSYIVSGKLSAKVVQQCVVSLTPLAAEIDEPVSGQFMPPNMLAESGGSTEITDGLDEPGEPIINGAIDLGELVTQHLALGLDPYPRQQGIEIALPKAAAAAPDRQKPFAGLAGLMQEKQKDDKK